MHCRGGLGVPGGRYRRPGRYLASWFRRMCRTKPWLMSSLPPGRQRRPELVSIRRDSAGGDNRTPPVPGRGPFKSSAGVRHAALRRRGDRRVKRACAERARRTAQARSPRRWRRPGAVRMRRAPTGRDACVEALKHSAHARRGATHARWCAGACALRSDVEPREEGAGEGAGAGGGAGLRLGLGAGILPEPPGQRCGKGPRPEGSGARPGEAGGGGGGSRAGPGVGAGAARGGRARPEGGGKRQLGRNRKRKRKRRSCAR